MSQSKPQIVIILNRGKQNQIKIKLDKRITNFGLPILQHQDYLEPFQLPEEAAISPFPFGFISKFGEYHLFDPSSPRIKLPINTSNYKQLVDQKTYSLCERYTDLQNANEAQQIIKLAKWLQFTQVELAISAAIAVNFYTSYNQIEIEEFGKKYHLEELNSQQIQIIYQEHRDLFQRIQLASKEELIKYI